MTLDWTRAELKYLLRAISYKRLLSCNPTKTDRCSKQELLSRYFWNIALSECFYPALHSYEISLRNHFYHSIANMYGDDWLINPNIRQNFLSSKEEGQIQKVTDQLKQKNRNRPYKVKYDDIISSLNLGFWTSLCYVEYEKKDKLYPALFRDHDFMPKLPTTRRKRHTLSERFENIRKLRNKIFHHEPICHRENLPQDYDDVLEAIQWMSPLLYESTKSLSRFSEVYQNQSTYTAMVEKLLSDN